MNKDNLIQTARQYAMHCHESTNHYYDGDKPYSFHLQMVYDFALQYIDLLPAQWHELALAAAWTHDTIEDCRQTYHDVKDACGEEIAEITYRLTVEKGKTRKERASEKYYTEISQHPVAHFVKLCDRLANTSYGLQTGRRIDIYREEHPFFASILASESYKPMLQALEQILFPE
jgi:(p)ppGpp synthase/HD superfamily hydrolase